jgi:ribonuclease P protein component
MLSKNKRLNLKTMFKWVADGKRLESPYIRAWFRSGDNHQPLVGISLSTKFFKLATDRNRARRLTAAVIQALYPQLNLTLNLVIMPKTDILSLPAEKLIESFRDSFDSFGLLNKDTNKNTNQIDANQNRSSDN